MNLLDRAFPPEVVALTDIQAFILKTMGRDPIMTIALHQKMATSPEGWLTFHQLLQEIAKMQNLNLIRQSSIPGMYWTTRMGRRSMEAHTPEVNTDANSRK